MAVRQRNAGSANGLPAGLELFSSFGENPEESSFAPSKAATNARKAEFVKKTEVKDPSGRIPVFGSSNSPKFHPK